MIYRGYSPQHARLLPQICPYCLQRQFRLAVAYLLLCLQKTFAICVARCSVAVAQLLFHFRAWLRVHGAPLDQGNRPYQPGEVQTARGHCFSCFGAALFRLANCWRWSEQSSTMFPSVQIQLSNVIHSLASSVPCRLLCVLPHLFTVTISVHLLQKQPQVLCKSAVECIEHLEAEHQSISHRRILFVFQFRLHAKLITPTLTASFRNTRGLERPLKPADFSIYVLRGQDAPGQEPA